MILPLPDATADTRELVYRLGYAYQKAGVMLSDLRPAALAQGSLLTAVDPDRSQNLMATRDAINQRMGQGNAKNRGRGGNKTLANEASAPVAAVHDRLGRLAAGVGVLREIANARGVTFNQ